MVWVRIWIVFGNRYPHFRYINHGEGLILETSIHKIRRTKIIPLTHTPRDVTFVLIAL